MNSQDAHRLPLRVGDPSGRSLARPVVFAVPPQNFCDGGRYRITVDTSDSDIAATSMRSPGRRGRQASYDKKFFEASRPNRQKGTCC